MAGGRKSRSSGPPPPTRTLVLDNGANSIKAGFVTDSKVDEPKVIPNCIARDRDRKIYVGSGLAKCRDFGEMQFRRPVEKGYIVSWEAQSAIWENEFFDDKAPLHCDPSETRLVLAEAPNSPPVLQNNCDQMVFEEFGFASYYRGLGTAMLPQRAIGPTRARGPVYNSYHDIQAIFRTPRPVDAVPTLPAEILLVIDSGYSSTTVAPVLGGRALHPAIRRVDVGGKLLTSYLTRLLSLRHYDMRSDPYIVNELKEQACYVSLDFSSDLQKCWKGARGETKQRALFASGSDGLAVDYILPDFHTRQKGEARPHDAAAALSKARRLASGTVEDILTLRNERFTVPELLFNPGDMGLRQPGVADAVMQTLDALPVGLWPGLLSNIVVVGGNALFDGFIQRLQTEIVSRVPDDCEVRVATPANPIANTWFGASNFARHEHLQRLEVTKAEYEEHGANWVARKFAAGLGMEE
ncbi:Actin/actin-like protein [Zalerion maritima]|uniref:Actin-like protein ARP6 n=1 Tax=Zalerion maritima TaxID=339359 RepID=A0AAD5RN66_9PEZI|nr:Actin/actin-like protein [Zalerion maritima]